MSTKPKKYFLTIDRQSIKVNPNAGSMTTRVLGRRDVTFDCTGELPKELIDGKNVHVVSWQDRNGKRFHTHGYVIDPQTEKMIWEKLAKKEWVGFNMKMEQNSQMINHAPISKYQYRYYDMPIVCCHCGHCCNVKQLETYDDGDNYTTTGCPKCGGWDCCELEYQNINDVKNKPE